MATKLLHGLEFTSSPKDATWQLKYVPNLYQQAEYISGQKNAPFRSYSIVNKLRKEVLGSLYFSREKDQAISYAYAPVGSFQGANLPLSTLSQFLKYVEFDLMAAGIKEIVFRQGAPFYHHQIWVSLLKNGNYQVYDTHNHHIPVSQNKFVDLIHQMQKRKIRRNNDLSINWHKVEEAAEVYDFIAKCRVQRNHKLSLRKEVFLQVVRALPQSFLLPVAYLGTEMIAASVIIKVNARIWYSFYPAHHHDHHQRSPLVWLTGKIYDAAARSNVTHIDLGTSEFQGAVIPGLVDFKTRIGGVVTTSSVYRRTL